MNTVTTVHAHLKGWSTGGEAACRELLSTLHSKSSNNNSLDEIYTVYQTLLTATFSSWNSDTNLESEKFVSFVRSVFESLPSSSDPEAKSSDAAAWGELLIDMVWSLDVELDEIIAEAKAAESSKDDESAQLFSNKKNAESDKEALIGMVKQLLAANLVQAGKCRERFDSAVLAGAGMIADKLIMDRKEVRFRTSLFYKQNKVNLLREQSEGYSKLAVELTSSVGPSHSTTTGRPTEPPTAIEARAHQVWERILSLIGHFDLDPNRALDIFLDVFSTHLASHYTFFLSLLSLSPWAPPKVSPEVFDPASEPDYSEKDLDEILLIAERRSNVTQRSDAGRGSSVLAQVLGFKFSHYQHPDITEVTPMNLYLLAAILIREGFITLEDLYPHLAPDEEGMEKTHKDYLEKVEARIAAAKVSQLAMAAPLESATPATSRTKTSPPTPKPLDSVDKNNQKIGLTVALLSIGVLRPAISLLTKYPWMVDAHTQLADLMLRILKHSISSFFQTFVTKDRIPGFSQPRARYGAGGVQPAPPRKQVLTFWAPTPPCTSLVDFVFFYPEWSDNIPVCASFQDLADVVEPLMRFVGVHISRDPAFITKYLRLGRAQINGPPDPVTKKTNPLPAEHPARHFWFKILRLYMLPALSLIRGNAVCAVEVWNTIRVFDITQRWRLYGEWKTKAYKSHPELRVRAVQVDREAKGILRRLSHNTIDSLAGPVAKLTHSNPCIFFANAVNQIMSYDNLAGVVIQVLKYSTNMGFDVLVFIILDALSNPHKQRVKEDGVNTSDWLQSLASFTGMLFRRYSADLTPVIKYIVHQLYNGQTSEIVVLRELIWKMAGIEPLPSLSESQISSMAGGPTLRIEAVASTTRGARLDPSEITQRGPQRLGKALLESSLALPLLIQVAQQRQSCVYTAQDAHLKSLAGLYDTTHGVLLQYLDLLTSPDIISPEEYAKKVLPSLADLGEHYGISAPICMQIIRPRLNEALLTAALAMEEQERAASEETEKRLKAALSAKREPGPIASRVASPAVQGPGTEPAEQKVAGDEKPLVGEVSPPEDVTMEAADSTPASVAENVWLPELSVMFDDVRKIAPGNCMELIGPGFYLTFWQLSTYDLSPPATRYDEEGSNLRTLSRQEDSKYLSADRSSDRAKRATAPGHRQRRDRYNTFVQKLAKEFKEQTAARAFTMKRLAREKTHWFADSPRAAALIPALIEHCFQPRCLLSPMDADFCAQFVRVMHLQGTPGFWTLTCYDRLLGDHVKNVVFSCSEYEAKNYGRFLFGLLSDLLKWHQDEQFYLQDNRTKSGSKPGYLPGLQLRYTNTPSVSIGELLKWSDFQQFHKKCHRKLVKCLTECIATGEFMHVYNTIIVLKEILPVFPIAAASGMGGYSLATAIDALLENEERGDLKILAKAYSASLKKREAIWGIQSEQSQAKTTPTQPSVKAPIPEKPSTPVAPRATASNGGATEQAKGSSQLPPLPPSAPRAHLSASNGNAPSHPKSSIPANPTKLAMESVPRPDFVKRVRPDSKSTDSNEKPVPTAPADPTKQASSSQLAPGKSSTSLGSSSPLPVHMKDVSRPSTPTNAPSPNSPRGYRSNDDRTPRSDPAMPPPTIPSQKPSAQELRETAKLTIGIRSGSSTDKPDDRGPGNGDTPSRRRSPSPNRPGTRNNSSESRASGGNSRSDRSGEHERSEGKGAERQDSRGPLSRRDSTRSDRGGRERTNTRDGERDKDGEREKDRDRHGDRDRKDRDRDRERERDRDREKDRDRNRERDRHRRDDRDRKDGTRGANAGNLGLADLPSRPESAPRHRPGAPNGEEGLGKRRRPTDDDPERTSKRSSRKDGHHEDRRRSADDRRRRDREGDDKLAEKRTPDAPASTGKLLPPSTPSAPRAMASDGPRSGKSDVGPTRDRDWKAPPTGPGSLRSRIGEKSASQSESATSAAFNKDDSDRDSRKRTASDREKDTKDVPVVTETDPSVQPSKRPKINRNRYGTTGNGAGSSAFARKTLPLAEKGRTDRKD